MQQVDKMMSTDLLQISLACNADPVDGTTLIILSLYKMSHNHASITEVKQHFVQLDGLTFRFQKPVPNSSADICAPCWDPLSFRGTNGATKVSL